MTHSQRSDSAQVPFHQQQGAAWLSVAAMLADLAFETDPLGRFTAFGPGRVLGRAPAEMLGQELAGLIAGGKAEDTLVSTTEFRQIVTTICVECVAWHGQMRLSWDGSQSRLFRVSLAPRFSNGNIVGTYGLLFDLEAAELALPGRDDEGKNGPQRASILDVETGLWTAPFFANEISRRLDRLDVEERPGTLIYLGFSRSTSKLRAAVAMRLAEELRDIVRPTDLLGRIDETTIGLWCDGMDHLTGGERAAKFCTTLPSLLPEQALLTVGVAPRWSGSGEDAGIVMEHAAVTLRLADFACQRQEPGTEPASAWRVWQTD
jgi:GGDEF domain-containing protein